MYDILGNLKEKEVVLKPYERTNLTPDENRKYLVLLKDIAMLGLTDYIVYVGKRTGKTFFNIPFKNNKDLNWYLECAYELRNSKTKSVLFLKTLNEEFNIRLSGKDEIQFTSLVDYTTHLPEKLFLKRKNFRKYKKYRSKYLNGL